MSTSGTRGTLIKQIIVAYICSSCKNPVIEVVMINANGWVNGIGNFAQKKLEKNFNKVFDFEIERLNNCKNNPQLIVSQVNKIGPLHYGPYVESSISGYDEGCPRCLKHEPWQSSISKKRFENLKPENYPHVYLDSNEAEKWAKEYLQKRINRRAIKPFSADKVSTAKEKLKNLIPELAELEDSIKNIPEEEEIKGLKKDREKLNGIKSNVGVLDFKNRKSIDTQLKAIQLKINELELIVDEKKQDLERKIASKNSVLLANRAVAYGYTGEIICIKNKYAFCYYAEPKDAVDIQLKDGNIFQQEYSKEETAMNDTILLNNDQQEKLDDNDEKESLDEKANDLDLVNHDKPVFCRKCGFELLNDSLFCSKCGTKVERG